MSECFVVIGGCNRVNRRNVTCRIEGLVSMKFLISPDVNTFVPRRRRCCVKWTLRQAVTFRVRSKVFDISTLSFALNIEMSLMLCLGPEDSELIHHPQGEGNARNEPLTTEMCAERESPFFTQVLDPSKRLRKEATALIYSGSVEEASCRSCKSFQSSCLHCQALRDI